MAVSACLLFSAFLRWDPDFLWVSMIISPYPLSFIDKNLPNEVQMGLKPLDFSEKAH